MEDSSRFPEALGLKEDIETLSLTEREIKAVLLF